MVDPSRFQLVNVIDTCAVWNVLSSRLLYSTARGAGCSFQCTYFVHYECLHKPRTKPTAEQLELQNRLREMQRVGDFSVHHLGIDDLQNVAVLQRRRNVSKGELSSIAFAQKTQQTFLTDDQRDRKLAAEVIGTQMVQTTPHLFGWLYFHQRLGDTDKNTVIDQHNKMEGNLAEYFDAMYHEALRCRSMSYSPTSDLP